jgi:uncharacterized iron-regulated protein
MSRDPGKESTAMKWIHPLTAVMVLLLAGSAVGQERTYPLFDLKLGTSTTLARELPRLLGSRIVLVGERHTEMSHHNAQYAVIRGLEENGGSIAVGLEMFSAQSQDALDRWVAGEMGLDEFQRVYSENWSFPWRLYGKIFDHAREMAIPLVGLNVPRSITRQVSRRGFQSLSPEQRRQIPHAVVCEVDDEYMLFIRRAYGARAHGKLNFTFFCEAQMVWDQAMAIGALRYMEKNPTHTMVILAGTGHAWKPGIPEQIRLRSSLPQTVILPRIPDVIDTGVTTLEDADYIIDTEAPLP